MRVLITDDANFMRMMLRDILEKNNIEICGEACNGGQMIEKYEELKPDVVTLDITMPDMDGLTALRVLKEKHPEAKVIMCSAMGQQVMVLEAIQNGAVDFIVKPFQAKRVLEALNKAVKK